MVGSYEGLRRAVLARRQEWESWGTFVASGGGAEQGLGEALLRRRGLAAWMRAWDEAMPAREPSGGMPAQTGPPAEAANEGETAPEVGVCGEMVRVLARMALSAVREGCACP